MDRPTDVGVFRRQTSHLAPEALYGVVYECIEATRTSIWDVLGYCLPTSRNRRDPI